MIITSAPKRRHTTDYVVRTHISRDYEECQFCGSVAHYYSQAEGADDADLAPASPVYNHCGQHRDIARKCAQIDAAFKGYCAPQAAREDRSPWWGHVEDLRVAYRKDGTAYLKRSY